MSSDQSDSLGKVCEDKEKSQSTESPSDEKKSDTNQCNSWIVGNCVILDV